ncbi:MAG: transcription elongation factor GreB [Pseudomonadales bacterium]
MSRYRPPRPKSSPYITPKGHALMSAELKYLWKELRPEVTQKVSEAAAMGDRSENAEYIYGKKQLREIDGRIAFLSKRLDVLNVVDRAPPDRERVFFGARVGVEDETGAVATYQLVGPDEFDRESDFISVDSPMAKALLGKRLDDEVDVVVGDAHHSYCITSIAYDHV